MTPPRPAAIALDATRDHDAKPVNWLILAASVTCLIIAATGLARAESHETVIKSHGYNEYDDLKYSPGDPQLDYVNPDAPLGGEISLSSIGTFDSMNPYATGIGSWGALSTLGYEDIMTTTSDEVGSYYCLLCETLEYPES